MARLEPGEKPRWTPGKVAILEGADLVQVLDHAGSVGTVGVTLARCGGRRPAVSRVSGRSGRRTRLLVRRPPHWLRTAGKPHCEVPAIGVALSRRSTLQTPGWAAFEIKLGPGQVDVAAASLLRMAARVDTEKVGTPLVLGVIVGFGYGLVREDGVAVIPIGALRP